MASIAKTATGTGHSRDRVRWRIEGRLVEKWASTLVEARALKTQAEADELGGSPFNPRAGARVLNDYFLEWIDTRLVRGRPLTASTRVGYRRLWARNIEGSIGRRELRAIRPETIRSWHSDITVTSGQDQAAKSYRLLRAVLATAEADDLIRSNPCRIRGGGQENHPERPMVATSLVLDLADAIDPRYRAIVLLAGFGGLRTGESLGLRRADIDLLHGEIHVVQQAQEIAGQGRITLPPKSDAGRRMVTIPALVVEVLDQHLASYTDLTPVAPVFLGPDGGALRRATLSRHWQSACVLAGGPQGLRLHDLRHHAATLTARMPGVTTKELMARIGHSSPRAALIYQHATAERDRAIASFLDEQVSAAERSQRAPIVALRDAARGADVGLKASDSSGRARR